MYPQRLPIVDADDGEWGDILRKYLEKEHFNNDTNDTANGGHKNVTIRAGISSTGGAPLKFSSGTLLTTPEIGAIEFAGDNLYITQTSGTTRKKFAIYDDTSGATGDIYYRNATGYFSRLPIGTTDQILTTTSGLPSWKAPAPVTAASVGLGNVNNTSDANKPISTATQNALDGKVTKGMTAWKIYATADYGSGVVDDTIDYSNVANAWQLAQRYDSGRLRVGTPVETGDATTKAYVDSGLSAKADASHTHTTGLPYDLSIVAFGTYTARIANSYGDFPFGIKLQRGVTFTQVVYRVNIADASGNLVVELRKNGATVAGSSATIAAANQVAGGTATGTWSFAAGDILTVYITGVGTNPGVGLIADIRGATA